MERANNKNDAGPVTEMAIVNTFTKLIFGDDVTTTRELLIIEAFRAVDTNVLRDSVKEMGEYLRSLGVREMIQLVARLRQYINDSVEIPASTLETSEPAAGPGRPRPGRSNR